jgi:RNA polymerase sigma-70 factor (ECF subfamily)
MAPLVTEAPSVHQALRQLPAEQRELIALVYWGGHSPSEVAAELDLPPATVEARIRDALGRLADLLEDGAALTRAR